MEDLWGLLRPEEQVELQLRKLYTDHHFHLYHLSNFEEYALYQQNRNFLREQEIITFNGNDGRMMALKPDVTLSIVKNTGPTEKRRIYYVEDVYRHDRQEGEYQKLYQVGLEIIDKITFSDELEVLKLAWQSLAMVGNATLDLSHMGILDGICGVFPPAEKKAVLSALHHKSSHEMAQITERSQLSAEQSHNLAKLVRLSGDFDQVYNKAQALLAVFPATQQPLRELKKLHDELLLQNDLSQKVQVRLDFSIVNDADYYSGILFQGFVQEVKETILFGGRYDNLLKRQGKPQGGIGFGMQLNDVSQALAPQKHTSQYLNVALPKGRMGQKIYELFCQAGIASADVFEDNRKLIFVDEAKQLRFFLVKPSDVAIYVEHGAADIGVVGKDVLLESTPDVIEFLDLQLGRCDLAVAAPENFQPDTNRPLRVATKYPKITREYYESHGQAVELIQLHGSIELAPLLDLADVIVDIVETGTTLKENSLAVVNKICASSARLIVNQATWRFKQARIQEVIEKVRQQL